MERSSELSIHEMIYIWGIAGLVVGIIIPLCWYIYTLHKNHSKEQKSHITTMTTALSEVANSNNKVSSSIDNQAKLIDRLYDVMVRK